MDMPGGYEDRRMEMSGTQEDGSVRTGGSGGGTPPQDPRPPKDPKQG